MHIEVLLFPLAMAVALGAGLAAQWCADRCRRRALSTWARERGLRYAFELSERQRERWPPFLRARTSGLRVEDAVLGPVHGRAALLCALRPRAPRLGSLSLLLCAGAAPGVPQFAAAPELRDWLQRMRLAPPEIDATRAPDPRVLSLLCRPSPMWLESSGAALAIGVPGPLTPERAELLCRTLSVLERLFGRFPALGNGPDRVADPHR